MSEKSKEEEQDQRILILETKVSELYKEIREIRSVTSGFETIGGAHR